MKTNEFVDIVDVVVIVIFLTLRWINIEQDFQLFKAELKFQVKGKESKKIYQKSKLKQIKNFTHFFWKERKFEGRNLLTKFINFYSLQKSHAKNTKDRKSLIS